MVNFKRILIVSILIIYIFFTFTCCIEKFKNHGSINVAFYSYFYGGDNNTSYVIKDPPSERYDCFYFTNNKRMIEDLKNTKWIAVFDPKPTIDDVFETNMIGKYIKTCPHKYTELLRYDFLCYLDNKVSVNDDVVIKYIDTYCIKQNYAMVLKEHTFVGSNVWDEYNESMKQGRYVLEKEKYKHYIYNQLRNGLKEKTDKHCWCGFIIRNMRNNVVSLIGETWYDHIKQCGIQDQISFFFVKQLFDNNIHIYSDNLNYYN